MSDFPPIKTRLAGVTFDNRDGSPRQPFVRKAKKGDVLRLRREADNPFDGNALAVDWVSPDGDVHQLGYVPRNLAQFLGPMADDGAHLTAEVVRMGSVRLPGKKPIAGIRMAIAGDLSACPAYWRTGFEPALAAALAAPWSDYDQEQSLAPTLGTRPEQTVANTTQEARSRAS